MLAIGLSWVAHIIVRKVSQNEKYTGDSDKILSLVIIVEAVQRFLKPVDIIYKEAILIAGIGLVVNILSVVLLHHDHEHSDHNNRAAYLHVLADALTSLSAILGLTAATIWDIPFIDSIAAIISSMVIIRWSIGLLKGSGKVLLSGSLDSLMGLFLVV